MSGAAPARVQRETRRASFARTLARLLLAHDVSDREVERLTGVAHQHVAQWRDPDAPRAMSFADALALPPGVRLVLAELLAGPGHVVVELPPDAGERSSLDHAAEMQRETADVFVAHLRALADGIVTRAEASPLRAELRQAIRLFLSLDRFLARAEIDGAARTEH